MWHRFPFDNSEQFWAQWDYLNQLYNQSHPMLDSVFVRGLVKYFAEDIDVLCCKQNNEVIALLLVNQNQLGITHIFCPSQVSISLCLIPESLNISELASTLSFGSFRLDCLYIDPLFQSAMLERNPLIDSRASSINMDILIEKDFEQYWASRANSLRKSLRRSINKITSNFDNFQFKVVSHQEGVNQSVVDYGLLESRGWKGQQGTAIHPQNLQGRFYQAIMSEFAALGEAVVFELRLGEELVASRLCIFNSNRVIILKTTYDEQQKQYAFGRVLLYKTLGYIFEKKLSKRVDFYTNATKEQLKWATGHRQMYHVSLYSGLWGRFCWKPLVNLKLKLLKIDIKPSNIELDFSYHIDEFSKQELKLFEFSSTPFTSFDWIDNFAENVAKRLGCVVYLRLKINHQTKAILPLIEQRQRGVKILSCFSNYYTPYIDLICEKKQRAFYFQLLLEHGQSYFSRFDRIDILPIISNQLLTISPALKRLGFVAEQYQYSRNWRELGIENYDQFITKTPSRLRSTIRRKKKKLTPELGYKVKEITADNLEQLIADYQQIYESSWKISEPFPEFIEQLITRCQRTGQARLCVMYHLSRPVAAQFWIVDGRRAYIYKLAYDPQYRHLSVGTVLSDYLFRSVIENDRVDEIDYLIGNDSYKSDWMDNYRPLYGICAYNQKSLIGWFYIGKKMIKDLTNKLLPKQ